MYNSEGLLKGGLKDFASRKSPCVIKRMRRVNLASGRKITEVFSHIVKVFKWRVSSIAGYRQYR